MTALAWEVHRDRIAGALRILRRRHDADEYSRILADRIAGSLDTLDALFEPTAADIVRAGFEVDEALEIVDRQCRTLHSKMGGRP